MLLKIKIETDKIDKTVIIKNCSYKNIFHVIYLVLFEENFCDFSFFLN